MRGQLLLGQAVVALMVMLLSAVSLVEAKDKGGVLKASELIGMKSKAPMARVSAKLGISSLIPTTEMSNTPCWISADFWVLAISILRCPGMP